jgi:hypothetical protein
MEILHKYFGCKKVEKTNDYKNEKNTINTKKNGIIYIKILKFKKKVRVSQKTERK